MDSKNDLRSTCIYVPALAEERARIDAVAQKLGVSRAEAVRRSSPLFYNGVKQGRRTGISPWKLNES